MRTKLGAPKAITGTAHKLAGIIYRLLSTQTPYGETAYAQAEEQHRERRLQRLRPERCTVNSTAEL